MMCPNCGFVMLVEYDSWANTKDWVCHSCEYTEFAGYGKPEN